MGCLAILAIPSAGGSFFFSAWLVMLFWGIVAPDVGVMTIGYVQALVVTIGLWMAMAPLVFTLTQRYRARIRRP